MVLRAERREGGLRGYCKTRTPAFIIKGDVPIPDSISQYHSFRDYIASLPLLLLSCVPVMRRVTRRSQAKAVVDNTQRSTTDPFLPLQSSTENNVTIPSPVIQGGKNLSGTS
jgi:hypothetical protein